MPTDDWADDLGWSSLEEALFSDLGAFHDSVFQDQDLQNAFHLGWFDKSIDKDYREAAREFVYEWLEVEYGIDFDEEFDWDTWREEYKAGNV